MDASPHLRAIWRHLGRVDKAFLLIVAAYVIADRLEATAGLRILLLAAVIATSFLVLVRWARIGIRRAIWRLRNRLVVAYLFIGLVPVLLMAILGLAGSYALAGQIAVHLVSTEFTQRMSSLTGAAQSLARVPAYQRDRLWQRLSAVVGESFPNPEVLIEDDSVVQYPRQPKTEPPPDGWGELSGVVVKDGFFYAWARAISGRTEVTIVAPLTRGFFAGLAPRIGQVTILEFGDSAVGGSTMRPHQSLPGEPAPEQAALSPPVNFLDIEIASAANIEVADWSRPPRMVRSLLSVHSRMSTVFGMVFSEETVGVVVLAILYGLAVLFLIVELISLVIGVSITRTITGAVHNLYGGTERVREGDFSHRIEVRGDDQIAAVSSSFNRMTENLERLMVVAKEKERMQAELEIAHEVQALLYPKTVPAVAKLELRARCKPARTVSGDYYDYQALPDGKVVLAIGDVAGKGISAALLMATLQSALRTHVRACLEEGDGRDSSSLSTSRLVGQLNEQLYADTSPEKYATFYFSVYDDDSGMLTYTNAGHLPPLLVRHGKVTRLDVNGMVVGAFPFAQYGVSRLQLESGDLLVGYTDGITEPENEFDEMFGEQRLIDLIIRNAHRDIDQIIGAVMSAVEQWTGSPELQDDMTLLLARRL